MDGNFKQFFASRTNQIGKILQNQLKIGLNWCKLVQNYIPETFETEAVFTDVTLVKKNEQPLLCPDVFALPHGSAQTTITDLYCELCN